MKRCLVLLLVMLASSALAQNNWFGLRTGYPLGVTVHYGIRNGLAAGTDLRISGNLRVRGSDVRVGVGVDALRNVAAQGPFVVYVGGGPAIEFARGGALLDIHALAGGEFRFVDLGLPQLGLFAELALGAAIGIGRPSEIPTFGAAVGFNWRF